MQYMLLLYTIHYVDILQAALTSGEWYVDNDLLSEVSGGGGGPLIVL